MNVLGFAGMVNVAVAHLATRGSGHLIVAAIRARKKRVYVTRRWRLITGLLRVVPDAVYSRL